ncbi:MAG: hypothetical protein H6599_10355 [Flavobacteriales bacterium]|nr:hypothetical protein [Flavobacteriales bacterium]
MGFYVTEDTSGVEPEALKKEERVQDSIKAYIQLRTPSGYSYKSLEFGELYVIKDPEIKKLDHFIEELNYLPFKEEELGTGYEKAKKDLEDKITAQEEYLKKNKIYPWYEVNHLYALENVISDSAIVYEFDFEVYPNYKIKDVHRKMEVSLDAKRYKMLKYFLAESPVYETNDWQYNERMNSEFYSAALSALASETDYKDKLLITIIDMTQYIYEKDSFDENDFAKKQMLRWEKENLNEDLKTISMSQLNASIDTIEGSPIITGYSMTHDVYTESLDDKKRFNYYYDLNYVIVKVIEQKL